MSTYTGNSSIRSRNAKKKHHALSSLPPSSPLPLHMLFCHSHAHSMCTTAWFRFLEEYQRGAIAWGWVSRRDLKEGKVKECPTWWGTSFQAEKPKKKNLFDCCIHFCHEMLRRTCWQRRCRNTARLKARDFFNTFFLSISVFRVITACLKCALMSSLLEWKPSATVQDSVCYTVVVLDSKFTADAVIFIVDKLCNLAPLPDKSCCVSQLVSYVLLVS